MFRSDSQVVNIKKETDIMNLWWQLEFNIGMKWKLNIGMKGKFKEWAIITVYKEIWKQKVENFIEAKFL
jgi:hypothetical protein